MAKSAKDLRELTQIILGDPSSAKFDSTRGFRVGLVNPRVWQYPDWMCPLPEALRIELEHRLMRLAETLELSGIYVARDVELSDEEGLEYDGQGIIRFVACKLTMNRALIHTQLTALESLNSDRISRHSLLGWIPLSRP